MNNQKSEDIDDIDIQHVYTFEECKQEAENGDTIAQYNLGNMYDNGEGVTTDMKKAVFWYKKAAKQGDSYAQFKLIQWYKKAAKQGDSDAQFNLGRCYGRGEGVSMDIEKANFWYAKANATKQRIEDEQRKQRNCHEERIFKLEQDINNDKITINNLKKENERFIKENQKLKRSFQEFQVKSSDLVLRSRKISKF